MASLPLDCCMPANCPPLCRWPSGMAQNLSGSTEPPSTHLTPWPTPTNQSRWSQLAAHGDRDFTAALRSMRFWGKLGWKELYAVDRIQVNIPLLLLLVAVKSKPCLWRKESVCGYEACSQPCAVSTVQSARPLHSRPWGYRLLKWSSVPSITSLYYLHNQEKGNSYS